MQNNRLADFRLQIYLLVMVLGKKVVLQ